MDEIPDSGSLSSRRRFAELQATPGSHSPGVILNGSRLKRVQEEVPDGGLVVDSPQDEGCPQFQELPGIPL
jgi:hypothetical protein